MRQTIKGLVAALAVMTAGAAPAMACGYYNACDTGYAAAYSYAAPVYTSYSYGTGCGGCGGGYGGLGYGGGVGYGGGYGYATLAEPTTQYYFANQGPTYSGPGAYAPPPAYEEDAIPAWRGYSRPRVSSYGYRPYRPWARAHRWGHAPRHYGYAPRQYGGGYYGRPLSRYY